MITVTIEKTRNNNEALLNCGFLAQTTFNELCRKSKRTNMVNQSYCYAKINNYIITIKCATLVSAGTLALPGPMRTWIRLVLNQQYELEHYEPQYDTKLASKVIITVNSFDNKPLAIDPNFLNEFCKDNLSNYYISNNQLLTLGNLSMLCKGIVTKIISNNVEYDGCITNDNTEYEFTSANNNIIVTKDSTNKLFKTNFTFEDLGIGGLDNEFAEIFRRAFSSRIFSAELIKQLGIKHVRGLMLYGPPGTGKTLIARQIGQALHAKEPKIVNGPEILNKYVGQSEENLRNLFADADYDMKKFGNNSPLHIIIFDEIDAICKQRGGAGAATSVNDSLVNQLLSRIDGVYSLNNVLIIGMTNRLDLIDEALLRPGRFEVQIEIGLPDSIGREQILRIHTMSMVKSNRLGSDVDLSYLSAKTENFSGAEIEGLVKAAVSYAFMRNATIEQLNAGEKIDEMKIKVIMDDFKNALNDIKPAFGVSINDLNNYLKYDFILHSVKMNKLVNDIQILLRQVKKASSFISVLLYGVHGSGKTSIAAHLSIHANFPFVRLVSAANYIGYTESQKIYAINKVFNDAYKSKKSIIILDDIERLVDYTPIGPRFNNNILQTLSVLVGKASPDDHKLLIIGTTSEPKFLLESGLINPFHIAYKIPEITETSSLMCCLNKYIDEQLLSKSVLEELGDKLFNRTEIIKIPIKKLFLAIDMAIEKSTPNIPDLQVIYSCLDDIGLLNQ